MCDEDEVEHVHVEDVHNPLTATDYLELKRTINPLQDSNCNGVDLYIKTLQFVYEKHETY